jgi:pre-mRNA-splicing factor ATP-dependent RNA helicase DHX16
MGLRKAFRLYTKWAYTNELDANTIPEIYHMNLGMVVLVLKSLGINDLIGFEFMDPSPGETLMRVLDLLYTLGALNDRDELTKLGRRMAELPVDPMLTKASEDYSYTDEIRTIVSMISWFATQEATRRPGLEELRSSWRRSLNVWGQWADTNYSQQFCYEQFSQYKSLCRARDIRDQLVGVCERVEVVVQSNPKIKRYHPDPESPHCWLLL